ncbi:hypothetical protein ACFQJ7_01270 [Halovenus rubra]|uniref:DUF7115 domain-containing protein n=2 Tax=Halovenus rubra TaxID=869890 RepID=A0ABD5X656_9EURY|nr:hypothetical protein [Halovenus rubra]
MEIPDTIKQRLGDEELESAVNLGDEDIICFTPSRTLLYRGEGLLSDDSLDTYDHDVERLDISEGRRKTSFTLTYVDSEKRFTVAGDRTEAVLERLIAGVLKDSDVTASGEDIEGVFRFSELTLIITDKRIIKHVGSYLWDADYEEYPYANVTQLEFEEGSVATSIVISVDGRPQRIKAPRGDDAVIRRALTTALFSYYEVDTLDQLNSVISDDSATTSESGSSLSSDIELDDTIDPLVTSDDDEDVTPLTEEETTTDLNTETTAESADSGPTTQTSTTDRQAATNEPEPTRTVDTHPEEHTNSSSADQTPTPVQTEVAVDPDDIEAMKSRLATLTKVSKRQNELLKEQQETITQLVEELRRQQ